MKIFETCEICQISKVGGFAPTYDFWAIYGLKTSKNVKIAIEATSGAKKVVNAIFRPIAVFFAILE